MHPADCSGRKRHLHSTISRKNGIRIIMNDKNSGLNFRRFLKTNITEFFRNFLSCNEIVGREGRYDRRLGISGKRDVLEFPEFLFLRTWVIQAPSTLRRRNLKTEASLWKRIKCFLSTLRRRKSIETQQSTVILDLCLWKSRSGKSNDYHEAIENSVFKMFSVHTEIKRKAGVFKFLRFEERFEN